MNAVELKKVAEETDLNIVLGTGHYRKPYYDLEWFDERTTDEIAALIAEDLERGIPGTGIKAGIIGEIGAELWYISAAEERSFRAAARAHKRTGATITTHAARWPVGLPQLDLLESEGVDLRRVIVGHCDTINIPEYHEAVARRGAFVQFDTIRGAQGTGTEYDLELRLSFVKNFAEKRLLDHLLLSHDICRRTQLKIHGSSGYDFIPTAFAGKLRKAGLSQEQVDMLLVHNPRRALVGSD
jgi:phosphotriesterase-related protein